jgi:predicted dienelactone hydrolase
MATVLILDLVVLGLLAAECLFGRRGRFLFAAGALVGLRVLLGGWAWQMAPAYLLFAWVGYRRLQTSTISRPPSRWGATRWGGPRIVATLFIVAAGVAVVLVPPLVLPNPRGSFPIGATTLHLVDSARSESYSADPNDHRELMVRVWYPAQPGTGLGVAPYWPDGAATSVAMGLPGFVFAATGRTATHAREDATVSTTSAPFPVLIFSHGGGMFAAQNTVLMEHLASFGYVVFSIDHTYMGLLSVFPDGRRVTAAPTPQFPDEGGPADTASATLGRRLLVSTNPAEMDTLLRRVLVLTPKESAVERDRVMLGSHDQRFVIGEVARLTRAASTFSGKLDTTRIGVFGMSYGGKLAVFTCGLDPRCRAGANLDGFSAPLIEPPPPTVPFLQMNSEMSHLGLVLHARARGPSYHVWIRGAQHLDFADLPLVAPALKLTPLGGSIATSRMLDLLDRYLLAFFDRHLRGVPGADDGLLDGASSRFPEVVLTR